LLDVLPVAGGLALLPEHAAAATVVVGASGVARALQRLAVGVGHHQDLAREAALSDDGDESIVPEVHGLDPIFRGHSRKLSASQRIVKRPRARILARHAV